jgi:hypothetical protein
MAYTPTTLSAAYDTMEGSVTSFIYTTADSLSAVLAANYITDAFNKRLSIGDTVEVYSGTLINPASGQALGAATFQATVGVSSLFASPPSYAVFEVISINAAGQATLSPAAKQTILMPLQDLDLVATGNTFKIGMPSGFIVTSALYRTAKAGAGAAAAVTLQVQIGGVATTGGLISLTLANQATVGAAVAGTAITANNIGAGGTTLEVNATVTTAFTGGDGWVEFTVSILGG